MAQIGHRTRIMTCRVAIREHRVFVRVARPLTGTAMLTIGLAHTADMPELERLAALDSADPLSGDVLVGRVNGEMRAALSLRDGRSIADPFVHSAGLVKLLRAWTS
jgi:hypothetical protein